MNDDILFDPWNRKKKRKEYAFTRVPVEFDEALRLRVPIDGFKNKAEYMRHLAKELRPTARELKEKGLLKDEDY